MPESVETTARGGVPRWASGSITASGSSSILALLTGHIPVFRKPEIKFRAATPRLEASLYSLRNRCLETGAELVKSASAFAPSRK